MISMALLLTAACTPAPPAPQTPPAVTTPPQPTGITLPPRPRELPLDGVDPCALLTPAQLIEFGLDGNPVAYDSTAPRFVGPACSIRGFEPRDITAGFALATDNGIEVLTAPGAVRDEISAITVAGFPAILARPKILDFCSVDVDVADGQFLDIIFRDGGGTPAIPQDQLCRDAVTVAEAAITTLLAR